jgi:uncharacterized membrane protein
VLRLLAGALLAVALASVVAARYVGFEHDTGYRWLVAVGVSATSILIAVLLLRVDARRRS